jgi:hypothetical protein
MHRRSNATKSLGHHTSVRGADKSLGLVLAVAALAACPQRGPRNDQGEPSQRRVYHVAAAACSHGSAACSEANSGLSREAPLCNVQAGLAKLQPGQPEAVIIHTGVYVDDAELPNWSNAGGPSPTAPIGIEGADGDPPSGIVLRGTVSQSSDRGTPTTADTAVLRIAGVRSGERIRNVRVKNLTINPGNVHGIFVFNASYVEVDNVSFESWQGTPLGGNRSAAFSVKGSDHVTLKNSRMSNGGVQQPRASGIEITGACSDVLVYGNVVHDFEGGCTHGSSSGNDKGRVLYAQNDFGNCKGDTDETATFQIYNDEDFMFYGNLVEVPPNGRNEVFSIRRTDAASDSASAHIIGNTVINHATGRVFAVRVWGKSPNAAVVRNNLFVGFERNKSNSIVRVENLTDCSGYDEDYNYVYGLPTQPLFNSSSCSIAWGSHSILTATADPGLDPAGVPNSGSPVVDAGDPALGFPLGSRPPKDIGAFDAGAGAFPTEWTPLLTTNKATPTIRWGGSAGTGDVVLEARNRPLAPQAAFRVQIDTLPSFDSRGIWTPLLDSGRVVSTNPYWTLPRALADGLYYARVTVSSTDWDQEWSDPYFRFAISGGAATTALRR